MKSPTPYRSAPLDEASACRRCRAALPERPEADLLERRAEVCGSCFFGQYDLLALFGMLALGASAITESPFFLLGAVVVQGVAVYAIRRRDL